MRASASSSSRPHLGFLHVVVQSGRGLPAADFSFLPKNQTSDPYVVLKFGEQRYRTAVKAKTLNPVWGEACTFQVGSFTNVGGYELTDPLANPDEASRPDESVLLLDVLDKDTWSDDDPLGKGFVKMEEIYRAPGVWCRKDVKLRPPPNSNVSGSIQLLVLFQREYAMPFYFIRIVPAVGHFVAGALWLVAAHGRWQPVGTSPESAMRLQPGVGACVMLAGILAWAAGVIEFVGLHLGWSFDKRMLAQNSVASGLHQSLNFLHVRFPQEEADVCQQEESLVSVKAKALGLSEYQISLNARCDIRLPVIVILALLPHAAEGLAILALLLQCQDWNLSLRAGEVLNVCALLLSIASVYLAIFIAVLLEPTAENPQRSPSRLIEDISKFRTRLRMQVSRRMRFRSDTEDAEDGLSVGASGSEDQDSLVGAESACSWQDSRNIGWVRWAWRKVWYRRSSPELAEPLLGA
mmetsp:Transcript_68411/g.164220  ORF Transcript_68411/g.164220 Transcript_68411/m.164220 type:complete len:465 (+) Transcript_68411:117-1511(+)|eukprot:CAMPEP_0178378532 /NCGR_PEP_ID=MMETSP0689_2-20121128/4477_1 /TAXON_ID=160604 /ORGANISM="Amphidinium massartii, Strain CS-259" /LENGTH=464 /DNA_ID=CAMNT_0019998609 /DNA_START=17 /DNA_END=1411 /DNA_ORIENTATION=+